MIAPHLPARTGARVDAREALELLRGSSAVFTVRDADGSTIGQTVSELTALQPEADGLVAAFVPLDPQALAAVERRGAFALHVLAPDDGRTAAGFRRARTVRDGELAHALQIDCELIELHRTGSTIMLVGRIAVHERRPRGDGTPVRIPTPLGDLRMLSVDGRDAQRSTAAALLVGEPAGTRGAILYVHRGCLLGDALGHLGCPRRGLVDAALTQMRRQGAGVLLYYRDDTATFGCCGPRSGPSAPLPSGVLAGFRTVVRELRLEAVRVLAVEGDMRDVERLGIDIAEVVPLAGELEGGPSQ